MVESCPFSTTVYIIITQWIFVGHHSLGDDSCMLAYNSTTKQMLMCTNSIATDFYIGLGFSTPSRGLCVRLQAATFKMSYACDKDR